MNSVGLAQRGEAVQIARRSLSEELLEYLTALGGIS
jgi:hypothetical protein